VIEIDGFAWFVAALIICGAHALYLRSRWRERQQYWAWWRKYDADAQKRHEEFMRVMDRGNSDVTGWSLDGSRERGQA
jgi:hypothetical protein